MIILTDPGFHAQAGAPPNRKPCKRGTWNGRMVVETVLPMLTTVGSRNAVIGRGRRSAVGWHSPWPSSTSSCNGMVYPPLPREIFTYRLPNAAFEGTSTMRYAIAWREMAGEQFTVVVDDDMQLEAIEPAQ